jgi:hypothetical protein
MPNLVEERAIEIAIRFLEERQYVVENVSRGKGKNSEHKGYDLIARKAGETPLRIEVKGCTRPWAIPDPYITEFDQDRQLVADFLYVVYFCGDDDPKLCAIPREAFQPDDVVPKFGYRIRSRVKRKSVLEPLLRQLKL